MPEVKVGIPDPNKFDLRTHMTDSRGRTVGTNTYRLHVKDGVSKYERPVNSGNLFFENNEKAGRVEVIKDDRGRGVGKKFLPDAEHIAYKKPITGAEQLEMDLAESQAKAARLEKELMAIKAEQEKKNEAASKRMVGDEIHYVEEGAAGSSAGETKGVSRSVKDDPIGARLTEPKSSSTPIDPNDGHSVPVNPKAEELRAMVKGAKAQAGSGPGSGPTPENVHQDRASETPVNREGLAPTPGNVHLQRAKDGK